MGLEAGVDDLLDLARVHRRRAERKPVFGVDGVARVADQVGTDASAAPRPTNTRAAGSARAASNNPNRCAAQANKASSATPSAPTMAMSCQSGRIDASMVNTSGRYWLSQYRLIVRPNTAGAVTSA
ncbi:MAG: hypothetical protein U1F68_12975 [Gammaproteobacteria bacterium]